MTAAEIKDLKSNMDRFIEEMQVDHIQSVYI